MSRWSHSLSCRRCRCRCRGRCHCRCHCCDCLHCPVVVVFVFILVAVAVVAIVDHQYKLKIIFAQKQITFFLNWQKWPVRENAGAAIFFRTAAIFSGIPWAEYFWDEKKNVRDIRSHDDPLSFFVEFSNQDEFSNCRQKLVSCWSSVVVMVKTLRPPVLLSLELTALTSEQW